MALLTKPYERSIAAPIAFSDALSIFGELALTHALSLVSRLGALSGWASSAAAIDVVLLRRLATPKSAPAFRALSRCTATLAGLSAFERGGTTKCASSRSTATVADPVIVGLVFGTGGRTRGAGGRAKSAPAVDKRASMVTSRMSQGGVRTVPRMKVISESFGRAFLEKWGCWPAPMTPARGQGSSHPSTPVPAASALGRGPAGFVGNTGSLGEALLYSIVLKVKPMKPQHLEHTALPELSA